MLPTILVIDDDSLFLEVMIDILAASGFQTIATQSNICKVSWEIQQLITAIQAIIKSEW